MNMTVDNIIPCVCMPHPPTLAERCDYGMPILIPHNSNRMHKQYWNVKCPNCGRGGLYEEKSAYLALKKWNELQKGLYAFEGKKIVFKASGC